VTRALREAAPPLAASAAAATALLAIGQTAWAPLVHHGPAASSGHAHAAPGIASAAWLVGWGLMVAAMMLPGAVPLVREVGGAVRTRGGGRERAFAVAGFLGAWGAFGCAVLAVVALSPGLEPGLVLVAAGAYQLTPAKRRALARCRGHARLLPPGWATGPDPSGDALRAGASHGVASVACCGPLMAALALAGMGAPALMLVAGVAMTVEVAAPRGPRITAPVGVALLAAGLLALV
jgi:predicted metal-binding membrane protein